MVEVVFLEIKNFMSADFQNVVFLKNISTKILNCGIFSKIAVQRFPNTKVQIPFQISEMLCYPKNRGRTTMMDKRPLHMASVCQHEDGVTYRQHDVGVPLVERAILLFGDGHYRKFLKNIKQ